MTHPNIGLIGKMGAGKSTVADVLQVTHGYRVLSFAAPLKAMVMEADPLVDCGGHTGPFSSAKVMIHLSDVLATGKTFEECKRDYPEVRRSLQRIGQGIRRIDPDYWVRNLVHRFLDTPGPVVVPDVRYPNEADALHSRGFTLVRITRPASEQGMTTEETRASLHASETALDTYHVDKLIRNDGEKVDLISRALDLV